MKRDMASIDEECLKAKESMLSKTQERDKIRATCDDIQKKIK